MVSQTLVEAPPRRPRVSAFRSVATFVENDRLGIVESVQFIAEACTFPVAAIGLCYDEEVRENKDSVGIDVLDAISAPFAIYGGVACWMEGTPTDYARRAREILAQGQDRYLEKVVADWAAGGTALTAGATITEVIANLEQHMDLNYPGQGVILMSRGDAVLAAAEDAIMWGLDGPTTINGTPVVASGWIDRGDFSAVGSITVVSSSLTQIDTINQETNTEWAVAEQVHTILVDCEYRATAELEEVTP